MAPLPYITSTGNIEKALEGIKAATVPDRVSQDFVKTILQIPGGSGDQMTTYLKKLNFATSDGTPTDLYTKFRNPTTSGQSVANAIRHAYSPLFIRNEHMYALNDDELLGLIVEETGLAHDANPVKMALACIKALKRFADFETKPNISEDTPSETDETKPTTHHIALPSTSSETKSGGIGLNLGYTININLPATSDQAVFNAIFKSIKENLLSDDDA